MSEQRKGAPVSVAEKNDSAIRPFQYQGNQYFVKSVETLLPSYLKAISAGLIGFYQRGVDNPYFTLNREQKVFTINTQIELGTFGQAAEATRIKLCAVLNAAIAFFQDNGYSFAESELGKISCEKSVLDTRAKGDKVNISDWI